MEKRKTSPVYKEKVIQDDRLDLDLERRYWQEHQAHRVQHRKRYYFYNCLFGDLRAKTNKNRRRAYHANIETARERSRQRKRSKAKKSTFCDDKELKHIPECQLNCANCPYPDCILPDNWDKNIAQTKWQRENPEYKKQYYEENKEHLIAAMNDYYAKNRDRICKQQRQYRQKPEVKARSTERSKRYRERNIEKIRAYKKAWYQKNKDAYNAQRREKRRSARDNP